jgi:hypothetical protein
MILPDFVLPSRVNQTWRYSGIDSLESCLDKKHFESYPHDITYNYNSRGFRDSEWPNTIAELKNAIWCVGDSFTVGIGSPIEHTWPYLLQQHTGRRTINVGMDGASNEWIAKKIKRIVEDIAPGTIVVQWSYFARRELLTDGNDEQRRAQFDSSQLSDESNINNFKNCVLQAQKDCKDCQLVNSIIPGAYAGIDTAEVQGWWYNDRESAWPSQLPNSLAAISHDIVQKLKKKQQYDKYVIHYEVQDFIKKHNMILVNQHDSFFNKDLARDGHHYDVLTATQFLKEIQSRFSLI